ncbi:MAG: hypothetical protein C4297_08495 [Gemmataceae bacterium]
MTLTGKILAALNLVVALLVWNPLALVVPDAPYGGLLHRSLHLRRNWQEAFRKLAQIRDGQETDNLLKLIEDPEIRKRIQGQWKRKSHLALRLAAGEELIKKVVGSPASDEFVKLRDQFAPDEFAQLVRQEIERVRESLAHEERELLTRKSFLDLLRVQYETALFSLRMEIRHLDGNLKREGELLKKAAEENDARRQELVAWYVELEQALADLFVVQARQRDLEELLAHTRDRLAKLMELNLKLERELHVLESAGE